MTGLLDEASVLINSSRDPSNLEAPVVLTWLRASGDTLGARRIWAEFRRNTAAAAQFRRAASFITDMPEVLEASGVGAFTYHGDHGDRFLPDKRHCGDERKSRRQLAREREAANGGGGGGGGGGNPSGGAKPPGEDGEPRKQLDYSTASVTFKNQGKVLSVGPSTTGQYTEYDAEAMRKALPEGACLPHLCTVGLLNFSGGCPKAGDPAHQEGGVLHTWPKDGPKRKEFNLKRTSTAAGKGGGGKGKGGGGKGGTKGKGKGKADGKGKGKANASI